MSKLEYQEVLDLCREIQGVNEETPRLVLLDKLGRSAQHLLKMRIKFLNLQTENFLNRVKIGEMRKEAERETTDEDVRPY